MVTFNKDGVRRYSDGNIDIGISKEGDAFKIYDYTTDSLTKEMTRAEVNSVLRSYNGEKLALFEEQRQQIKAAEEMQKKSAEIDSYARKNISDYKNLSSPAQSQIRRIIEDGRAKGVSDDDVLMYAKVAAHSGLDIVFSKEANVIRNSEFGIRNDTSSERDVEAPSPTYADGLYSASRNTIFVNPEASRTQERLLIHELDHAIRTAYKRTAGDVGPYTRVYKTAVDGVSEDVKKSIKEKYGEAPDINADEANAYYAEIAFSNKHVLEKLVEAEPTLKEKILSFFKGASEDYADVPKLSGAAKRYYRTYKKLFDEFSARNGEALALSNSEFGIRNSKLNVDNGMEPNNNKNGSNVNENGASNNVRTINGNNMSVSDRRYAGLADVESKNDISWLNVAYDDSETKSKITKELHNKMISDGLVIKITDETSAKVKESYPDLQRMKKKERLPILKEKINHLKNDLRTFLNQLKNKNFEFEVNGSILEAKLYNVGIDEVLEKVTQQKAEMLYTTEEIFKNSKYLYSTPDYDGDPNVYRWNYFYSPVQIGEDIVGVRIAIRDMANPQESQIYNWGIKKDTSLDGIGRGKENRSSYGISSDVSNSSIPQPEEKSNGFDKNSLENSSDKQFALPIDEDGEEKISGAEVMSWLKSKPESDGKIDLEATVARGLPYRRGKSNLTVGELRKVIANSTHEKVYSKADAMRVVNKFSGSSGLTVKAREEIADTIWQFLNDAPDVEYRRDMAHDISEFIVAKILADSKTENPDALEAAERLSYLRTGIGKLSFSDEDIAELRHAVDEKGLKLFLRCTFTFY